MRFNASDDGKLVSLLGGISEESDFAPVLARMADECVLDLGGVQRINSMGVRKWLTFVREVPAQKKVRLTRCPVLFVSQMNMIANFAGAARVESVYIPLICESCGEANEEIVELAGVDPSSFSVSQACAKCGNALALDADPATFFAFLSP